MGVPSERLEHVSSAAATLMPGRLANKVAVVTGAASGIGQATAIRFAAEGAAVALFDVETAGLAETKFEIDLTGAETVAIPADLSELAAVKIAFEQAHDRFGRLDLLVNAAGVSGRRWGDGPTADCTEEAWDRVLAINLKSVFLCSKVAIQAFLAGDGGAIVSVASVLGLVGGDADFATHAYAASKGGIIALTRAIAVTYAPQRIRANVICPGLIATPMSRRAQSDERIRARLKSLQPLTGDFGTAEDVANAAVYLASDEARFVTGVVHPVDGGWTAQ